MAKIKRDPRLMALAKQFLEIYANSVFSEPHATREPMKFFSRNQHEWSYLSKQSYA